VRLSFGEGRSERAPRSHLVPTNLVCPRGVQNWRAAVPLSRESIATRLDEYQQAVDLPFPEQEVGTLPPSLSLDARPTKANMEPGGDPVFVSVPGNGSIVASSLATAP
jgi:hypothetical protein